MQYRVIDISYHQGRPTRGPRKGFEWPAQYFLKPSVPSILAEVEDRFNVKDPFFLVFFQVLEITMISEQKVGNLRLISGEDLFFVLKITMGNLRLISGEDLFF